MFLIELCNEKKRKNLQMKPRRLTKRVYRRVLPLHIRTVFLCFGLFFLHRWTFLFRRSSRQLIEELGLSNEKITCETQRRKETCFSFVRSENFSSEPMFDFTLTASNANHFKEDWSFWTRTNKLSLFLLLKMSSVPRLFFISTKEKRQEFRFIVRSRRRKRKQLFFFLVHRCQDTNGFHVW